MGAGLGLENSLATCRGLSFTAGMTLSAVLGCDERQSPSYPKQWSIIWPNPRRKKAWPWVKGVDSWGIFLGSLPSDSNSKTIILEGEVLASIPWHLPHSHFLDLSLKLSWFNFSFLSLSLQPDSPSSESCPLVKAKWFLIAHRRAEKSTLHNSTVLGTCWWPHILQPGQASSLAHPKFQSPAWGSFLLLYLAKSCSLRLAQMLLFCQSFSWILYCVLPSVTC